MKSYIIIKPINIEFILDLTFIARLGSDIDSSSIVTTIKKNRRIIHQVTNALRDNEEIRKYKNTIYSHKITNQIRREL